MQRENRVRGTLHRNEASPRWARYGHGRRREVNQQSRRELCTEATGCRLQLSRGREDRRIEACASGLRELRTLPGTGRKQSQRLRAASCRNRVLDRDVAVIRDAEYEAWRRCRTQTDLQGEKEPRQARAVEYESHARVGLAWNRRRAKAIARAHRAQLRQGSTRILACASGFASVRNASPTPSTPVLPVTIGATSTSPSASARSVRANSSGV